VVAPVTAVVGILPKYHGALAKLWDLFTASLVAVAKFTLASGVMTMVLGAVQAADMSGAARLFFVIVATVVGIVLTKPIRSLKTVLPGLDPNQSYLKKLVQHIGPALAGGAGSYIGVERGTQSLWQALASTPGAPDPGAGPAPSLTHAPSLTGLPAPEWTQPTFTVPQRQPVSFQQEAASAAPTEPRALPAGRPALPAGSVEAEPVAAEPTTTGKADPAAPATPTVPPAPTTPTPAAPVDLTPVVQPDGIWVSPEPGRYHPGAPTEEYVPRSELDLADDGTEHERIVYHSTSER